MGIEYILRFAYPDAASVASVLRRLPMAREVSANELPACATADDLLWRDLRPVLDEEIDRLPEKYRVPFVLCYLEGHTNEEAAEQLGCPKGTILSRLARGRERLRSRLSRRGLALSAAGLTAWGAETAAAAVPAGFVPMKSPSHDPFISQPRRITEFCRPAATRFVPSSEAYVLKSPAAHDCSQPSGLLESAILAGIRLIPNTI